MFNSLILIRLIPLHAIYLQELYILITLPNYVYTYIYIFIEISQN
jgi:hypothetical protein